MSSQAWTLGSMFEMKSARELWRRSQAVDQAPDASCERRMILSVPDGNIDYKRGWLAELAYLDLTLEAQVVSGRWEHRFKACLDVRR